MQDAAAAGDVPRFARPNRQFHSLLAEDERRAGAELIAAGRHGGRMERPDHPLDSRRAIH